MSEEQPKAAFVTFYSFKGGVGRSMALINTAGILAGRGFRVLVIDLDLEAPGLSYLNPDAPDAPPVEKAQRPLQPGFVDLLHDAKTRGQEADLFTLSTTELADRYTRKYYLPPEFREFPDGSLRIMPAGRFDGSYAQRFDALNVHELYQVGLGEPLIRAFKKIIAEAGLYDYVLVDSRTGFSDEAGICTRDLADHLMILSGLNRQNVEGTCDFLRALREQTKGRDVKFDIILSPVPNGEDKLVDEREAEAAAAFTEAWGADVKLTLQIPYHPQLALTEEPHIFRRRRGYLFEAYRAIEIRLLEALGHVVGTLLRRVEEAVRQKDYRGALRDAQRMVRLDDGRSALAQLVAFLGTDFRRFSISLGGDDRPFQLGKAEIVSRKEKVTLAEIVDHEDGCKLMEFVVDHLPVGERNFETRMLLTQLRNGFPNLADRLYKRLIEADPKHANNLGNYAVFLEQRGDKEGAETYYRRAIEADPKHAGILGNYADFLEKRQGDKEGAETYYRRAIEADPKHANNLGNYAVFLEQRGDKEGAETYYRRAIEADPKHANNLGNYAAFLMQQGDKEGAETYYRRAIEADPKHAGILGNYADFLEKRQGDKEGAETYYRRAIEADPKHANNLGNYAVFLEQRGDKEGAETYYRRAIEADPKHAGILGNYADFLEKRQGDKEGAETCYRRAIEADPKHAGNLGNYAVFLMQRGDKEGAETYYRRAIEADPKRANNLGNYAAFLEQRGDKEGAETYYRRAIEADPKHANNLGNYAVFLEQRGDKEGAETYYRRAIEADPKHAGILGNYGQMLIGSSRVAEGANMLLLAFENSADADTDDEAEICFSLWLASRMQGHDAERWERTFKYLVQLGFGRRPWSFAGMLEQAKKVLAAEEFDYAEALAQAFLDEAAVARLDRFERWRALEPLDPKEARRQMTTRVS